VAALETCTRVAQRIVGIEGKLGPVTRAELDAVINAVARMLARFVPDERLTEAQLRSELGLAGLDSVVLRMDVSGDFARETRIECASRCIGVVISRQTEGSVAAGSSGH